MHLSRVVVFCVVFFWGIADAAALKVPLKTEVTRMEIIVNQKDQVHLYFPDIIHYSAANEVDYNIIKAKINHHLIVQPLSPAEPTYLLVELWEHIVLLKLQQGPRDQVEHIIKFTIPTSGGEKVATCGTRGQKPNPKRTAMLYRLHEESPFGTRTVRWGRGEHRMEAKISNVIYGERYLSFRAKVRNFGRSYPLDGLAVRGLYTGNTHLSLPVFDTADGKLPKELERGDEFTTVVLVKNVKTLQPGWVLQLLPSTDLAMANFRYGDEPTMPRSYKKLTLGVEGRGGAAQHSRGAETDLTMMQAVGVRARYGVASTASIGFAVEGDFSYWATGEADLDGTAFRMTGARLLGSGVVTFGDRYVPFIRIGAGFFPHKAYTDGESEFGISAVAALGFGIDAWLGKRLAAGVSVDTAIGTGKVPVTFEGGVHLSFALDFDDSWD